MKALNNDRIVFAFFLQSSMNRLTDDNLVVVVVVADVIDDNDGIDDALRLSSMMKCMKSICLKVMLKLSGKLFSNIIAASAMSSSIMPTLG